MSIVRDEIQLRKSSVITNTSANGGRITGAVVADALIGNGFDSILPEEMASGGERHRKFGYHIANDDDLTLYSGKIFLDAPTSGDDWAVMRAATQRDTMADHPDPGSERLYGVAFLAANVSAGAQSIILEVEDESIAGMFADGDTVVITDKATPFSTSGNRELRTIDDDPVVVGTQVTIHISEGLANAYTTSQNARVSSVLAVGDIACSFDNFVHTGSGTYDDTTYPVLTDNLGTIEQTWTREFLDATTFEVIGDVVGSVGTGTTASNFAPVNPTNEKPYFTLQAAGHGGTNSDGDTTVFQTHPAIAPFWLDSYIPDGAEIDYGNRITPVLLGYVA